MQIENMVETFDVQRELTSNGRGLPILRGITFNVASGEWVALTGPSGSGKSTLLGILAGIDRPTYGSVRVAGFEIANQTEGQLAQFRNEMIGIVFQSFNLIPTMTALENVEAPMYIHPNRREARPLAVDMLRQVGLSDRLHHLPHQLSGGEQQRVAIARALVTRPQVLLADEPTGNLDSATSKQVLQIIEEMRNRMKLTIIMVTHDASIAARADRCLHIMDGKLAGPEPVQPPPIFQEGGSMRTAGFFLKTAFTHLRRGGQRNLVAFFCVAFGVMSLVTMTTMAKSIEKMLVLKPYELIGGDLTLDRVGEDSISVAEEDGLKKLAASGLISDYTMMDYSTSLSFRKPESGELFFPSIGMGVDTTKYPLAGALTIADPLDKSLTQLLKAPGDVIITRDLALAHKLKVNDQIILSNLDYGQPLTATIRGIASDTPNHQGSKLYYSHETSYALTGMERTANTVLVNTKKQDETAALLESSGWRVFTSQFLANATAAQEGAIAMVLNDIGLLGLLVSGIGIANTMQVLLKRRRKEVAIWKTLGYTAGKIQAMFITEAAMLGISGSLLGAGLGVLLSYGLVGLFSRVTTILMHWSFSPVEVISGLVIGIVTTIIFAMWAIVSTSRIRPLALLRSEALVSGQIPVGQGILLGLLLVVPFLAIAVWVLKSFLIGLLVLFGSILGLIGLAFMLWLLMLLAIKLLPLKRWSLGKISKINLRQRGMTQVIAMVALFIGVIMLGLGAVITNSGQEVMGALNGSSPVENLAIYAPPSAEAAVKQELTKNAILAYSTGHVYKVNQITASEATDQRYSPTLMARSDPGTTVIHGAAWGTRPDGAYAYPYSNIPMGSVLQITDSRGEVHAVEVVGTFENGDQAAWPGLNNEILVSDALGQKLGTATNSQFFLTLKPAELSGMLSKLGKALPQTTLLSMPEFQARFVRQYQNLFMLVAVMAGLSILAGLLLVANSVSLAMLDRRFEIGVLKSIGYSRWQVLASQVVEYTLMSVVVTFTALLLIWGMLALAGLYNSMLGSLLMLKPSTAALIALVGIGFTALTVLWATWKPSSVSPVFVLNDRE